MGGGRAIGRATPTKADAQGTPIAPAAGAGGAGGAPTLELRRVVHAAGAAEELVSSAAPAADGASRAAAAAAAAAALATLAGLSIRIAPWAGATPAAARAAAALVVAALALAALLWRRRAVGESVLVVRGVGVQLSRVLRSGAREPARGGGNSFVARERIAHVVINECVEYNGVYSYLALQLRERAGGPSAARGDDWEQFVVLFEDTPLSIDQMEAARAHIMRVLALTEVGKEDGG